MPKKSERQSLIHDIEQQLVLEELLSSSSDEEPSSDFLHDEDENDDIEMVYMLLQCNRYLQPRESVSRASNRLKWLLRQLDETRFKQEIRVTRGYFRELVTKIKHHPIFQKKEKSRKKQRPVIHQLLVALKRFGNFGNGAAVGIIARFFSISGRYYLVIYSFHEFLLTLHSNFVTFFYVEGAVDLYTKRCIVAILSLEKQTICWPDTNERQEIKNRIKRDSDFPCCLGFIDGTLFVLENKPLLDGEDYFSRKGKYGLSGMIICDDQKRIRYIYTGWPGCAHDGRVYNNSAVALQPEKFFNGEEYLLADSAYTPSSYIVPAFKKPPTGNLSQNEARFNNKLSNIRVRVEHCIGILKARFQSLKGLRTVISGEKDVKLIVFWIRACCVLHNLFVKDPIEPGWLEVENGEDEDLENLENENLEEESVGQMKRRKLMSIVLA